MHCQSDCAECVEYEMLLELLPGKQQLLREKQRKTEKLLILYTEKRQVSQPTVLLLSL